MERAQAVELLTSHGYKAVIEDNIPMIYLPEMPQREFNRKVQEIDSLLRDNGYGRSYGWKFLQANEIKR
jgi:hypothetical protein